MAQGDIQETMERDQQEVEAELMGISAIQDDLVRLERIIAWCAVHPDEVPFALSFVRARLSKGHNESARSDERRAYQKP